MKLKFKIEGLDCINCANELEESIGALSEVESVQINFMTEKMIVIATNADEDKLIESIKSIIKREEPDVKITKM